MKSTPVLLKFKSFAITSAFVSIAKLLNVLSDKRFGILAVYSLSKLNTTNGAILAKESLASK